MSGTAPPQKIAFLGIGLMGRPMAMRLLNAGYALTAWNRTRAKANELAALNARVAQDIHRGFAESRILDLKPNAGQAAALLAIEKLNPGIHIRQAPAKLP